MPFELESKIRIDSHEPVRERLRAAGAAYIGAVLETNRFFDNTGASLRRAGCGLRLRVTEILDGRGPGPTLTFKGPLENAAFKQRHEIETPIADANALTNILAALGFQVQFSFQKRRESWEFRGCKVELDELPRLGSFVEVEGPDESTIRSVLEALTLSASESIRESYLALLIEVFEQRRDEPLDIRFP